MKITVESYDGTVSNDLNASSKTIDLKEWATSHELEMVVTETTGHLGGSQWIASFRHTEIKDDVFLSGACGYGRTPAEAISNYVPQIRGKRLVVNAYSSERREIRCPANLVYQSSPSDLNSRTTALEETLKNAITCIAASLPPTSELVQNTITRAHELLSKT